MAAVLDMNVCCKLKGYPPRTFVPLSNVKDCVKTANDQAMMVARDIILFWRQVPR